MPHVVKTLIDKKFLIQRILHKGGGESFFVKRYSVGDGCIELNQIPANIKLGTETNYWNFSSTQNTFISWFRFTKKKHNENHFLLP